MSGSAAAAAAWRPRRARHRRSRAGPSPGLRRRAAAPRPGRRRRRRNSLRPVRDRIGAAGACSVDQSAIGAGSGNRRGAQFSAPLLPPCRSPSWKGGSRQSGRWACQPSDYRGATWHVRRSDCRRSEADAPPDPGVRVRGRSRAGGRRKSLRDNRLVATATGPALHGVPPASGKSRRRHLSDNPRPHAWRAAMTTPTWHYENFEPDRLGDRLPDRAQARRGAVAVPEDRGPRDQRLGQPDADRRRGDAHHPRQLPVPRDDVAPGAVHPPQRRARWRSSAAATAARCARCCGTRAWSRGAVRHRRAGHAHGREVVPGTVRVQRRPARGLLFDDGVAFMRDARPRAWTW
jgi:hypothetical protein